MNLSSRQSRLYGLTEFGKCAQTKLCKNIGQAPITHDTPEVDWDLYGWVCYRHRRAVLLAITEPMQPAAIKRKARSRNSQLRMSANNVRDIIRLFMGKGLVRSVQIRRKAYLRYELTDLGRNPPQPHVCISA